MWRYKERRTTLHQRGQSSGQSPRRTAAACARYLVAFFGISLAQAQQPPPAPGQSQITVRDDSCPPPETCEEKHQHQINAPFASPIILLVMDQQNRPVPGATVVIGLPTTGPGANFIQPRSANQFDTDALGKTAIDGLRANRLAGPYQITATASFGGETATTTIKETNTPPPFFSRHKKKLIVLGVVCAAVVTPVLALRKPPSPSASITTISPVGPVGPPH